jgi:hypothetical protein
MTYPNKDDQEAVSTSLANSYTSLYHTWNAYMYPPEPRSSYCQCIINRSKEFLAKVVLFIGAIRSYRIKA